MNDLSPALLADLRFAVSRYGLAVEDVPRDHQGKTITDRLAMLHADGESYCHGEFQKTDLRSEHANVWELFPENPATIKARHDLVNEVGALLEQELSFRLSPHTSVVRGSDLPTWVHVDTLERLLSYIDGTGDMPDIDPAMWPDDTLFAETLAVIPGLRDAEVAAITREHLITELATGAVPPVSAALVRRALDSDTAGLRNADITLAAYRVSASRIRDGAERTLEAVKSHFDVAERVRQVRDDLDLIDQALHWPGPWQTAPRLPVALPASAIS